LLQCNNIIFVLELLNITAYFDYRNGAVSAESSARLSAGMQVKAKDRNRHFSSRIRAFSGASELERGQARMVEHMFGRLGSMS